jgi:Amt family ammonium transporter
VAASVVVWLMMTVVGPRTILNKVDDTLGVVYTHGIAGLAGGLLTGLIADPNMIVYTATGKSSPFSVTGLIYGNPRQFLVQLLAVAVIIVYDGVATFVIMKFVGLVVPLRMPEAQLEVGDVAIHGDVAFDLLPVPSET